MTGHPDEAGRIARELIAARLQGDGVALTVQALLVARDGRRAGEVVGFLGDMINRRSRTTAPHRTVDFEVPNFGLGRPLVGAATQFVNAITDGQVLAQRAIIEEWESADLPARQRLYLMATVVFLLTAVAATRLPARRVATN